jgi:hypothetical protein
MKYVIALAFLTSVVMLSGCGKKKTDVAEQAPSATSPQSGTSPESAPAQQSATPAASAEPSPEDAQRAKKLAMLDYATMEDQYINDPHAQWATSASASSTFGDDRGTAAASNLASNVIGPVDGKNWTNNHMDIGFDWLQVGFDKPVFATEIRVVFAAGQGAEAVTKLEVQDAQGVWATVWSGLSDVKTDVRGDRTWFVHKFDKTKTPTKAARITIANNVQQNYKVVDAVQLVGE